MIEREGVEEGLIRKNHSVTTSLTGRFGEFQRLEPISQEPLTLKDVGRTRGEEQTPGSHRAVEFRLGLRQLVERGNDIVSSNMGMERTIGVLITTITFIRVHLKFCGQIPGSMPPAKL